MKLTAIAVLVGLAIALIGCVEEASELTINADGSGSLHCTWDIIPQAAAVFSEMSAMPGNQSDLPWPPSEDALHEMLVMPGVTVQEASCEEKKDGGWHLEIAVTFEDLAVLVSGETPKVEGIRLARNEEGNVVYRSDPWDTMPANARGFATVLGGNDERLGFAITRFLLRGGRFSDRVTFPEPVLETNGQRQGGNAVLWETDFDTVTFEAAREGRFAVIPGDSVQMDLPLEQKRMEQLGAEERVKFREVVVPEAEGGGAYKLGLDSIRVEMQLDPASRETEGTVEVVLGLVPPEGVQVAACEEAELAPVVTDDRRRLRLEGKPDLSSFLGWGEDRYEVKLRFTGFERPASRLSVIKGSLLLLESSGVKPVRIGPLEDWVGKQLAGPELGDLELRIEKLTESSVQLRMPVASGHLIEGVRFEDASGSLCRSSGSMTRGGRHMTREYYVEADPKGMIVLMIHEEPQRRRIPISFTNVPLP